jgi:IMP dehydrogenase
MLIHAGADAIVIDTAHGDSDGDLKSVFETLRQLKKNFSGTDVVAGNISEAESAKRLADLGADGIKVGQGPGSICITRVIAGIGCPQVTAVYNCAKAVEGTGIPICADGGIKYSGDITIALGAGASYVMLGRLLAGTDEAPGDFIIVKGIKYKVYRGMGSLSSMRESLEARDRYRQQGVGTDKLVPEGVDAGVPYDGPVKKMLEQYLGGLCAGMGYVGAGNIQELWEKADFYRISPAGLAESHPHDIIITADAPNYHK